MPTKATASVAIGLLVAACATPRLDAIAPGAALSVETAAGRDPLAIGIHRGSKGPAIGTGATGGAIAGLVAAASCTAFLAGVCVIFLTAAGASAGTGLGALFGAATTGLDSDAAKALDERARARNAGMEAELVAAVRGKLAERWRVVPAGGRTRLTVALERVSLLVDTRNLVSLSLDASITLAREGREAPEKRSYGYRGLAAHPDVWSERDGAHLDDALGKAYQHVAEAIYLELAH